MMRGYTIWPSRRAHRTDPCRNQTPNSILSNAVLKPTKSNDLEYMRFVKSTFYSVPSKERKEDWENSLMEKENSRKNHVRSWIITQPTN